MNFSLQTDNGKVEVNGAETVLALDRGSDIAWYGRHTQTPRLHTTAFIQHASPDGQGPSEGPASFRYSNTLPGCHTFPEHFQPLPDVPNEVVGLGALCELAAARGGNMTHSGTHLAGDPACSSAQGLKALSPPTASHEVTTAASKRSKGCYGRGASSDPWVCQCGRRG